MSITRSAGIGDDAVTAACRRLARRTSNQPIADSCPCLVLLPAVLCAQPARENSQEKCASRLRALFERWKNPGLVSNFAQTWKTMTLIFYRRRLVVVCPPWAFLPRLRPLFRAASFLQGIALETNEPRGVLRGLDAQPGMFPSGWKIKLAVAGMPEPFIDDVAQQPVGRPGQVSDFGDQLRAHPMHADQHERLAEAGGFRRLNVDRHPVRDERAQLFELARQFGFRHARADRGFIRPRRIASRGAGGRKGQRSARNCVLLNHRCTL